MSDIPKLQTTVLYRKDLEDKAMRVICAKDGALKPSDACEVIRRAEAYPELAKAADNLSKWAAAIHWNGARNTMAWMDGLKERIEKVQALGEKP